MQLFLCSLSTISLWVNNVGFVEAKRGFKDFDFNSMCLLMGFIFFPPVLLFLLFLGFFFGFYLLMLRVMGKLQGGSREEDGSFENPFHMVSFGFLCSLGLAKGSCVYCGGKFLSRFLQ